MARAVGMTDLSGGRALRWRRPDQPVSAGARLVVKGGAAGRPAAWTPTGTRSPADRVRVGSPARWPAGAANHRGVIPSPRLRISTWHGWCAHPRVARPGRPRRGGGLGGGLPRGDAPRLQLLPLPRPRAGHGRGPDLGHLREGLAGAGPVPPGPGRRLDLAPRDRPQRRDRPLPALAPRGAARGGRRDATTRRRRRRPCARRSPAGSRALLAALPERERELLALKYGADATNRAIATITGLGESNVGTILHRTVVSLRARWDEGGPQ